MSKRKPSPMLGVLREGHKEEKAMTRSLGTDHGQSPEVKPEKGIPGRRVREEESASKQISAPNSRGGSVRSPLQIHPGRTALLFLIASVLIEVDNIRKEIEDLTRRMPSVHLTHPNLRKQQSMILYDQIEMILFTLVPAHPFSTIH